MKLIYLTIIKNLNKIPVYPVKLESTLFLLTQFSDCMVLRLYPEVPGKTSHIPWLKPFLTYTTASLLNFLRFFSASLGLNEYLIGKKEVGQK